MTIENTARIYTHTHTTPDGDTIEFTSAQQQKKAFTAMLFGRDMREKNQDGSGSYPWHAIRWTGNIKQIQADLKRLSAETFYTERGERFEGAKFCDMQITQDLNCEEIDLTETLEESETPNLEGMNKKDAIKAIRTSLGVTSRLATAGLSKEGELWTYAAASS